jgi:hypothetical protein
VPRDDAALADLLARRAGGEPSPSEPPDPPDAHPWRRDVLAARMAEVLSLAARRTEPGAGPR